MWLFQTRFVSFLFSNSPFVLYIGSWFDALMMIWWCFKFLDCCLCYEQLSFVKFYGERVLGLTDIEPLVVVEPFLLLRRSLILIGVDSTIVYRSVFFRFADLLGLMLSVSFRRRFLDVDLATVYWSWNRTSLIGVTVCGAFRPELGVLRAGDGVCDWRLGVFLRGGVGAFGLFWGVDLTATGDRLLVRDL